MALYRLPGAARGDCHFLVVIAGRAARGEGVVEPEVVLGRDLIGDIGKAGGAFVGGNHQVRIVTVAADGALGRHRLPVLQTVGEVEEARDEALVDPDAFRLDRIAPGAD